jgi:chemotaxis protein MotB
MLAAGRARRRMRLAAAALAASATACVTASSHERVAEERDRLAERVVQLEAQSESLAAERDRLYGEVEDLRLEREALGGEVEALRAERDRLSARESELGARARTLEELHPTYEGLVRDLEADLAAARIEIDRLREGFVLTLPAEVLFPSGSAELTEEGEQALVRIAGTLGNAPYQVRVQGHTDAVPIRGALAQRFATNWELAAARAARVVRVLAEHGVPADRLEAVSLAEHHPVAPDDTPEGRAANRRIELRLVPLPGAAGAPPPPGFEAPGPASTPR